MGILNTLKNIWIFLYGGWKSFWRYFHKGFRFCRKYRDILFVIGLLAPKKVYPETDKKFTYGVIICARNEHLVVGNLIDSIHAQTYDSDKIKIFVVADNCTDNTAEICRNKGCIVYERFDKEHARKGYAMEYLFDKIDEDYGIESLDAYIVFDADNLLHPKFVEEMNKVLADGSNIAVGYRNTKNFDRNFISAGYGIHFIRSVVSYHRPRVWLNTSTHIAGTGFMVASHLLKDGWHYVCLTEDTQFTINSVADGESIAFCEDAEFFDEQPYQVKVMVRQRMRWIKGRLYTFLTTFHKLLIGLFTRKGIEKFTCFDMFMYVFPSSIYYAIRDIVIPFFEKVISLIIVLSVGNAVGVGSGAGSSKAFYLIIWAFLVKKGTEFIKNSIKGALVVIREHKRIHCPPLKLAFYTFLFPWFDMIGAPLSIMALFSTSKWKPIKHDEVISIDQLTGNKTESDK